MITTVSSKNKYQASKSVSKATNKSKTVYERETCYVVGDKDHYLNLGLQDRGGGDRKLDLLSQVLSCQRRSATALLPIGCQMVSDVIVALM
jgi:hypothetical protein